MIVIFSWKSERGEGGFTDFRSARPPVMKLGGVPCHHRGLISGAATHVIVQSRLATIQVQEVSMVPKPTLQLHEGERIFLRCRLRPWLAVIGVITLRGSGMIDRFQCDCSGSSCGYIWMNLCQVLPGSLLIVPSSCIRPSTTRYRVGGNRTVTCASWLMSSHVRARYP